MPRHNLKSIEMRSELTPQGAPYWQEIDTGLHLGYRRNKSGPGVWVVRKRLAGRYLKKSIGDADDLQRADGVAVLSYTQARKRAGDFEDITEVAEAPARLRGPYTVADAISDYLDTYQQKGNPAAFERTQVTCNAQIIPALGKLSLDGLKKAKIDNWKWALAKTPPKSSKGGPKPPYAVKRWTGKRTKPKGHKIYRYEGLPYEEWTDDMRRKRKSTANRILTILKAALNHAWIEGMGGNREEWQRVKPFEDADAPRVAHLSKEEAGRLLTSASDDFRPMARAALLTGCRYGELCRLKVADLGPNQLFIAKSKTGKPRHVPLSPAGLKFFRALAKGKSKNDLLLTHQDGSAWGRSHQTRPMQQACEKAGISPVGFHALRNTYATLLLEPADDSPGVSIRYVAEAIGDSVATTAKHYGHVQKEALQKEIARKLPSFGGAA